MGKTKTAILLGLTILLFSGVSLTEARPAGTGRQGDVELAAPEAQAQTYTLDASSNPALGTYLAAANGMTLYVYSQDKPDVSHCTGFCATLWPPYTVSSSDALKGSASVTGRIGTIVRADGQKQVTYNGRPLYFYKLDIRPGQVNGENVAGFTVARP